MPAALRPFARALEDLEPEFASTLAHWLPRLSLLVGPLASASEDGHDPDGVDGVTRKGPYDRLLLSEWAMALEVPEEFLRRAVMSEHLFTQLAQRGPKGSMYSLVLVDPGPDQLGTPRLVHLAAALVGQARAARAKAQFAWGATTEPVRLFTAVDEDSVRHVLGARRILPLEPAALERWAVAIDDIADRVGAKGRSASVDVLFVGGAHLEKLVARSSFSGRARVVRVDAREDEALDVTVPHVRPARPLRLPTPHSSVCVRALRDPFERPSTRQPKGEGGVAEIIVDAGIVIPPGGRRILARTKEGILAFVEPNSPRAPLGPPKLLPLLKGDVVLAAGMEGKRPFAIVFDDETRSCLAVFKNDRVELNGGVVVLSEEAPPPDRLRPLWNGPERKSFRVDRISYGLRDFRELDILEEDALIPDFVHRGDRIQVTWGGPRIVVTTVRGELSVGSAGGAQEAHLGTMRVNGWSPGALAVHDTGSAWQLVHGDTVTTLVVPDTVEVLTCVWHPSHGVCLVARQGDRHLAFFGHGAMERHAFSSRIVHVAPNLDQPQLAVLTEDGTLTVLFLKTQARTVVCRSGRGAS